MQTSKIGQRQKKPLNKAAENSSEKLSPKTKFLPAYQTHVREAAMVVLFKSLKINLSLISFKSQIFKFI